MSVSSDSVNNARESSSLSLNKKKYFTPRPKVPHSINTQVSVRQQGLEQHTRIPFSDFYRFESDHVDGNRDKRSVDNIQHISPLLHSIKTNNLPLYEKIMQKPLMYVVEILDNMLKSPDLSMKCGETSKHAKIFKEFQEMISSFKN